MAPPIDKTKVSLALEGFNIPPRPELLLALQNELDSSEPDVKRISRLISVDIAISGFVLKVVNSPIYALTRQIDNVQQACLILGAKRIVQLVRSILLRYNISDNKPDTFINAIWDSSAKLAAACMAICQHLHLDFADEAYSVGMFNNAGMALIYCKHKNYPSIIEQAYTQEQIDISSLEESHLNTSHELLSFMIADSWGLSHDVCNVLAYHHSCQTIFNTGGFHEKQILSVLKLAEHILQLHKWLGNTDADFEWKIYSEQVLDILELEVFHLIDIGEYLFQCGIENQYHVEKH
ncbi:HDOD domain-containing protein [Catenovulum sp. SX2]|uniref:HDOD domain-containing protein n=1 Tax=Catenovulum sp. SX2 TaxID=3398614 RepID=UPI003F841CB2